MIDWSRVNELRDEVGAEDFEEVAEIFLEEVEEVLARLRDNPDPASFEADFHFLKGSALNLGFAAFSTICDTGERAAAQGLPPVDIPSAIQCYDDSKTAFLARLDSLSSAA